MAIEGLAGLLLPCSLLPQQAEGSQCRRYATAPRHRRIPPCPQPSREAGHEVLAFVGALMARAASCMGAQSGLLKEQARANQRAVQGPARARAALASSGASGRARACQEACWSSSPFLGRRRQKWRSSDGLSMRRYFFLFLCCLLPCLLFYVLGSWHPRYSRGRGRGLLRERMGGENRRFGLVPEDDVGKGREPLRGVAPTRENGANEPLVAVLLLAGFVGCLIGP
ncbi:hypothetical protein BDY21DRAFT_169744 [Lineolata rhizophorae]|uniref:Uncharacterized protein n=1 Tax=Lineolata rhizophorae TaxID=578093 RepID=A0A6A6P9L3_9PEZI|nr:hypothetical protein BDY21DRAFT_169744 [Lineolata rhizophorae]